MIKLINKCELVCFLCSETLEIEIKSSELNEIKLQANKRNWFVEPKAPLHNSTVYCSDCYSVLKQSRTYAEIADK